LANIVRLLAVLGKINPAVWDAIIPHGPVGPHGSAVRRFSPGAEVALNPQPLPPHELLVASAAVAHDIAFAAVSAEAAGSDAASRIVARAVDDWCGTRPPHIPIPWPRPWPFPWPPEPDPHPDWDIGASRVVGALSLASVASRLEEGEARDALSKGAEQLLEAGLAESRQ
jgi:hypothetical protein